MLVIADDLPSPSERANYLGRLTPAGSLGSVEVILRSPEEFLADAPSVCAELADGGLVLVDRRALIVDRLAALRSGSGS
jgi:hypothetical protein